jgi:DNA-binding helix-hairpin-helix protein with protein kinase domain
MDVILEKTGETVTLGAKIGSGTEGEVYELAGKPETLVKLFHKVTKVLASKIAAMLALGRPPLNSSVDIEMCWPAGRVLSTTGDLLGFEMLRASGKQAISMAWEADPAKRWVQADYEFRLEVARRLCLLFDAAEAHGCVIGDMNPENFLIGRDKSLAAIDVDSWQVTHSSQTYRCDVGTSDFIAPELIGRVLADVDRKPASHRWGLGAMIWHLLVGPGNHPFAAAFVGRSRQLALMERIEKGIWAYAKPPPRDYRPRTGAPINLLHPVMQRLAHECFNDGHGDPSQRPKPSNWFHAISQAQADQAFLQNAAQLELQAARQQLRKAATRQTPAKSSSGKPRRRLWIGLACSLAVTAALAGGYGLAIWRSSTSPSPSRWEAPNGDIGGKPTPELWIEWANED